MYRVKIVNQTTPIKNQMNLASAHYIYTFHAMCVTDKKMMTAGVLNEFPALLYVVAGTGSGLHCWLLIFFLCLRVKFHKSLFWVPILAGVPIGSLFHKKLGTYFKAWGSLLVLVAVLSAE